MNSEKLQKVESISKLLTDIIFGDEMEEPCERVVPPSQEDVIQKGFLSEVISDSIINICRTCSNQVACSDLRSDFFSGMVFGMTMLKERILDKT